MRFPSCALLVLVLACSAAHADVSQEEWIPLAGDEHPAPALVSSHDLGVGAVELEIDLAGLVRSDLETKGGRFSRLNVVDAGVQGKVGRMELPALRLIIAIPYGADPTLSVQSEEVVELSFQELGITAPIVPVQAPVEKLPGARERAAFDMDPAAYETDAYQLEAAVALGQVGAIRGHRFVALELSPVDVNPVRQRVRILRSTSVRIDVSDCDLQKTKERAQRYSSRAFDGLKARVLLGPSLRTRDLNGMPNPPRLLIITEPGWAGNANLLAYVDWKRAKGFRPELVTTGTTGTTKEAIKNYIQNAYDNWAIPPTSVLLVGDTGGIPNWVGSTTNNPATDLNYTMLEGDDYFPDIEIGRWSVADATDLNNIASKSLSYEQVGWTGNDTWEKYAVFMASNDNYSITEATHNYVISNYLQPDGYSYDRLYCHTYGATTQQVANAHNAGRSLSIFSGHGDVTYWADGPVFYQSNVNSLTNTVYPFVQSYACLTGQYTAAECFSETWIRATRGAIGMMASSVYSYWTEDDILEKRAMEGFCATVNAGEENQTWPGGMMNYAKLRYYAHFGNISTTRRYFEMYNIMGDPTINLWTAVPSAMTVTHDATMGIGAASFDVTVSNVGDWVLICVHDENDEVYATEYLFANGTASLDLGAGASTVGTLHVTVTGHDRVPYQTTIPITAPSGPHVVYAGSTILG
ncbi:hypothetical protein JXA88_18965, partial [Candidatus Fermentibacteria bacterium]|nr:hypothetical protein [Candidatus Fermentibacteria bacterium]